MNDPTKRCQRKRHSNQWRRTTQLMAASIDNRMSESGSLTGGSRLLRLVGARSLGNVWFLVTACADARKARGAKAGGSCEPTPTQ